MYVFQVFVDLPGKAASLQHENAMLVPPGTMYNIQVTQNLFNRLPEPHGHCRDNGSVALDMAAGKILPTHTKSACESLCMERKIVELCKCKDAHLMHLLSRSEPDIASEFSFCEDIDVSLDTWLSRVTCMHDTRTRLAVTCGKSCDPLCTERTYNVQPSKSKWPIGIGMGTFYKKYIYKKPYSHRFHNMTSWMNNPQTDMVNKNFIYLYVHSSDTLIHVYSEVATITLSNFLSRLGGSLNLWSGITIIVFMEVIEMFYKIAVNTLLVKKNKQ